MKFPLNCVFSLLSGSDICIYAVALGTIAAVSEIPTPPFPSSLPSCCLLARFLPFWLCRPAVVPTLLTVCCGSPRRRPIHSFCMYFFPPSSCLLVFCVYLLATRGHPVKRAFHTAWVDVCLDAPALLVQLPVIPMRLHFVWIFVPLVPPSLCLLRHRRARKASSVALRSRLCQKYLFAMCIRCACVCVL